MCRDFIDLADWTTDSYCSWRMGRSRSSENLLTTNITEVKTRSLRRSPYCKTIFCKGGNGGVKGEGWGNMGIRRQVPGW
jgi:hypothetical protein